MSQAKRSPMLTSPPQIPTPQRPILGVALDMDGLLFETESLYWQVGQQILQRRGHQFTSELQQRMMGRVGVAAIEQMIAFHSLSDDPHTMLAESDAIYHELLASGPEPMPGMDAFIALLQDSGVPFGVATSSRRIFATRILEPQPWCDSLAFLLTGDDVVNGKPHPEMYCRAAERLAIPPTRMLVLEDSGNGSAAAVAAGAVVIAVPNACTHDHPFENVFAIAKSLRDPIIAQTLGIEVSGAEPKD
jgi:HAD superfamily hydrolase (TIGR01509 family)